MRLTSSKGRRSLSRSTSSPRTRRFEKISFKWVRYSDEFLLLLLQFISRHGYNPNARLKRIFLWNLRRSSYFLSSCSKFWRVKWWHHIYFFQNTSSGSVCCNDVIVQLSVETLPFGGIGESGYGSYHGKILETYEPFHKLWLYWNIVLYFLSRGHPN